MTNNQAMQQPANDSLGSQLARFSSLARHFARFCRQLDPDAPDAALLGAALVAERNLAGGDTCLMLDQFADQGILPDEDGTPTVQLPPREPWIAALEQAGFVGQPGETAPLILESARLYLARHWQEEVRITEILRSLDQPVPVPDPEALARRLDALFPVEDPEKKEGPLGQKRAAAMALTRRLAIITGGPGTGKTTTVTRILALLLEQEPGLRIRLAAPTGKAAARLTESIRLQCETLAGNIDDAIRERLAHLEAATLHRLLGWRRDGFAFNADNPLPCDCLLIDECSMIDQTLMAHTLAALPEGARLILLGDRHQLSSVEAGSVLGDLTGRGEPPAISRRRARELVLLGIETRADQIDEDSPPLFDCLAELSFSYRFADGGGIGQLAAAVNSGDIEGINRLLDDPDAEIAWMEAEDRQPPGELVSLATDWYAPLFDAGNAQEALERFNQARILTARADGPWGEEQIRQRLEDALRRRGLIPRATGRGYRGLPILIRKNDRETGLFNGDTGILWSDANNGNTLYAWFLTAGGELARFSLHQLPEWQPAWTLTVHRSQGSEYDRVALVLPPTESRVVSRELIYTGITRARKHCLICGKLEVFIDACNNKLKRSSGLHDRLLRTIK